MTPASDYSRLAYVRLIIGRTGLVVAPLILLVYTCLGVMIWQNI